MSFLHTNHGSTSTTTTTTTRVTIPSNGHKRALCMGINNYPDPANRLAGCVNDATDWAAYLNSMGFGIVSLIDAKVTSTNFTEYMGNYISEAKAGDWIVGTYSGHGSSVPDIDGDEADGKDECICLYDRFYLDDEIRVLFSKLPEGVNLVFISDSCHSGTVTRDFIRVMNSFDFISTPKYLPPILDGLAVRIPLFESNNTFASPILKDLPEQSMNHILMAGCKNTEYSYDAFINGRANGAFSAYALQVLKENAPLTFNYFNTKLQKLLPSRNYPQTPQLEGSDTKKNQIMFQ